MMDRRSFFSKIFGGAAAAAVAPHIKTKSYMKLGPLRKASTYRTFYARQENIGINGNSQLLGHVPSQLHTNTIDFHALENNRVSIEKYLATEKSAQDGLGVTLSDVPPGCPLGYY